MIVLANAARLAWDAIASALKPPAKVDYLDWAVRNIVFTKRESPEPGPYNPDRFAYFNEILRALSPSDPCRIVTLAKSAQLGGTVLANVFTGGSMDMDPGDLMYVHPTDNNAERWSKMKLTPMLRGTVSLKALFPEKSREGGNSVLFKERADGLGAILISGANSPASLSQVTVPRQVQDDLAKWEMNAAGDPEVQADSRSWAITFDTFPASVNAVERDAGADFAKHDLLNRRHSYEFAGPGDDVVTLSGEILPFSIGGLAEIDLAHSLRDAGDPVFVDRGDGGLGGWFIIVNVKENYETIMPNGIGFVVKHQVKLERIDDPGEAAGAGMITALLSLFG